VGVFIGVVAPVRAQQAIGPPSDRTNVDRQRQQDMSKREYQLRNFGVETKTPLDDKQKKALLAQVEQDFNRILFLHNQIVRAVKSDEPLDYRFVSDATGEIKKRSSRLQSTLSLRESDADKVPPEETKTDELKSALLSLCVHIKDFVTNPIIETPGTVDEKHLTKAKRDLANVISLSGLIRKQADQHK